MLFGGGVDSMYLLPRLFWPAYSIGKEVWENWKKGERADLIGNLLTFLLTWGIFYFGILYIFYDEYFR